MICRQIIHMSEAFFKQYRRGRFALKKRSCAIRTVLACDRGRRAIKYYGLCQVVQRVIDAIQEQLNAQLILYR